MATEDSSQPVLEMVEATAIPENGYTVIVKNKAKNNAWNLLKCTIR